MPFLAYSPNIDSSTQAVNSIAPSHDLNLLKINGEGFLDCKSAQVHAFIFNWPGTFERCLQIEKELQGIGLRVQVINSDPDHKKEGWLNLGPDAYFSDQFRAALARFDGDVLLHIQADIVFHEWHNLISDALRSRRQHNWGVYAPNVLNTSHTGRDITSGANKDASSNLSLAACVDETCWFIDRSMIQLFYALGLNQLFADNHYGWGWDLVLCALSHLSGRPVLCNYQYTLGHRHGSGNNREAAEIEFQALLSRLPPSIHNCIQTIYGDKDKLIALH